MRFLRPTGLLLTAVLLAACGRANEHPPDQLLRDSLGLEESDQVLRVEVAGVTGAESASPATVRVPAGGFVEFVTTDRRLHTLTFAMDSLAPAAADFLRSSRQDQSPPLLELGARFVVSFEGAPAGRYPYLLEGNGESGRGVVVVEGDGSEG